MLYHFRECFLPIFGPEHHKIHNRYDRHELPKCRDNSRSIACKYHQQNHCSSRKQDKENKYITRESHVGGLAAVYQIWHDHLRGNQAEKYWSLFAMFHISKFFHDWNRPSFSLLRSFAIELRVISKQHSQGAAVMRAEQSDGLGPQKCGQWSPLGETGTPLPCQQVNSCETLMVVIKTNGKEE